MPFGRSNTRSSAWRTSSGNPSFTKSNSTAVRSSTRSTTLSPLSEGIVETRKSTSCPRAVIAVADAQPILERLNMNVRRAGLDCAGDQLIDETDNRRLARQVLQPLGVLLARFGIADDLVRAAGAAFTSGLTLGIKTVKGGFEL